MAQPTLRFDDRVAIVTGAGGGLGRVYALELASRGCAVVVNDLGGSRFGEGAGSAMADAVVEEIRAAGGKAVPNYDSVEFGEKLVKTAVDAFGRIDIVINNAGILRDKSILNMTDLDWDLIMKVHLKGAYAVTKAAWPYMRKQKYGKVINTSSNSGIYGNFGQSNYAAAKTGLIGFTNTLAKEGERYGIFVNTLVPTAGSRLTATVMPEEALTLLNPAFVTPLTVYLCHEDCQANGNIYEGAAGWFGRVYFVRGAGKMISKDLKDIKAEHVRDNWEQINDMSQATHFSSSDEITASLLSNILGDSAEIVTNTKTPKHLVASRATGDDDSVVKYTTRDVVLYALGVGACPKNLKFVFESSDEFAVLPTYFAANGLNAIQDVMANVTWGDGYTPDPTKILHGEQYVEIHAPIPTEASVKTHSKLVSVLDKGSGASIIVNAETYDVNTGTKLATLQFNVFQVGCGNFGGQRAADGVKLPVPVPKRTPDAVVEQKTAENQAALYRMSGDLNPLHIDPAFAALLGFKEPILHGLCSFGFATRHVIEQWADGDVSLFKAVKARFAKPVIPGQTLVTETWRGDNNRIHFQTKVKETGAVVISDAYVDLKSVKFLVSPTTGPKMGANSNLKSPEVFKGLKAGLDSRPDAVAKVKAVFLFVITDKGKEATRYTVDLKNGSGSIYEGEPKDGVKANVTFTLDDADMEKLTNGKLNPQQAFMGGKMKLKGNIMLAQKLQILLGPNAKI